MAALRQTVAPASEPVSLAEAKAHLRVDGTDEDTLISSLLAAAREYAETFTRRQLVTATWRLSLDAFPCEPCITLPNARLQSVTSITYYDADNALQTIDSGDYYVDAENEPGRIVLSPAAGWPTTYDRPNAVQITFVAGYGDAADVPEGIKAAIKLWLGDAFENRGSIIVGTVSSQIELTVDRLLWPYRVDL